VLLEVTLLIAVVYPNILTIFSLLGGFCCGIIILVLPSKTYAGLLKIKTKGWDEKNWKAIIYKYGSILLFLIGTAGAILSFFGIS
jgi:amino acid permease